MQNSGSHPSGDHEPLRKHWDNCGGPRRAGEAQKGWGHPMRWHNVMGLTAKLRVTCLGMLLIKSTLKSPKDFFLVRLIFYVLADRGPRFGNHWCKRTLKASRSLFPFPQYGPGPQQGVQIEATSLWLQAYSMGICSSFILTFEKKQDESA